MKILNRFFGKGIIQARGTYVDGENVSGGDSVGSAGPHAATHAPNGSDPIDDIYAKKSPDISAQTGTTYSLQSTDNGTIVTMDTTDSNAVTIPLNLDVDIVNVLQIGVGITTITGATGVTVNGVDGGSLTILDKFGGASCLRISSNNFVISGAIVEVV